MSTFFMIWIINS